MAVPPPSRIQEPFLFRFHQPHHVASMLQYLPHGSRWSLKLQPSHPSSRQEIEKSNGEWGKGCTGGRQKGMSLTAESAPFKELSWKPHLQLLFIAHSSSLAAREAGKCSLTRLLAPIIKGGVSLLGKKKGTCNCQIGNISCNEEKTQNT